MPPAVCGLVASTFLTLFVIPALYTWFAPQPAESDEDGETGRLDMPVVK